MKSNLTIKMCHLQGGPKVKDPRSIFCYFQTVDNQIAENLQNSSCFQSFNLSTKLSLALN